ncbi:MAG: DUF4292 domain-containing protein [Bacteroidota bacterium]
MRFLLFALSLLFFAAGCATKGGPGQPGLDGDYSSKKIRQVLRKLDDNRFDVPHLEAKARVKVESQQFNIGGTAVIRVERDKAIWVSVKKFGFEGARALVRPDSFFVINRLNGDYTAEPLSFIEEKYKIPARFDLLQEMVLGNAVFFSRDLSLETVGESYILDGKDSRFATRHVVDARGYRLKQMDLTELAQNRKLTVNNQDFRPVEGLEGDQDFAYSRTIEIDAGKQSGKFEMTFTKLDFVGPFGMPFRKR